MRVIVRFGRAFAGEAGASELHVELDEGATAAALLHSIALAAPGLSCITGKAIDLSVAALSVNGEAVDPRAPEKRVLREGDEAYLASPISGG